MTDATDETLAATSAGPGAGMASADPPAAGARGELERGALVSRYVVLSKLGAGGMGVVWAAYDPELDRKVALKLLRAQGTGTRASEGRTRLLREAQALARLSHPNVVAVHDVGTHGEEVFLAMEFVEGKTLGAWAKEAKRSWREKLRALVDAGRGVAAAHAAGLLHRDLKPENVMVGSDGRVRVMDLGLARAVAGPEAAEKETGDVGPSEDALAASVTRAGAVMGTPAYMAPEQHLGLATDARTDQFAYCVTAWEVLYGERPFGGDTLAALAFQATEGKIRPPPGGTKVPSWLERVLRRGLAAQPDRRWPTVDALLVELGRGQARARTRRLLGGAVVVSLAVAGGAGWRELDERRRIAACEAEGASIATSWNDEARAKLRAGLLATGIGYAETTADRTLPYFDAQAQAWGAAATESCLDATVHERWDAELLDASRLCLDDRRMELEMLVDELSRADATALQKAVTAAAGLARVTSCRDERALAMQPSAPAGRRDELREVRARLARAGALSAAGRYPAGLEEARAALDRASAIGWTPLTAAARVRMGALLDRSGDYDAAAQALADAYFEAARVSAVEVAAEAATQAVYTVGYRKARHEDGLWWGRLAELELGRMRADDDLRRANLTNNLAAVHETTGGYAEAKALHERALAIRERALGPDHPDVATSLNNLANVQETTGEYAEAKTLLERALGIREQALGPGHPAVAQSLVNLAVVHAATGAYAEAKALLERALAIWEQALGEDHPDVATCLSNLALAHQAMGTYGEAKALHERALAIREQALGEDHPDVAASLNNLALVHQATGAYAEAKALFERSLAIHEKALGKDHPDVATILGNLADVHQATGAYAEAKALHERALAIWEQALGPDHPDLAWSLTGLGEVALAEGRPAEAVGPAERSVKVREAGGAPAELLAESRFVLARALWESRQDRERARALARQAAGAYAEAGASQAEALVEVEAWLGKHGGSAP